MQPVEWQQDKMKILDQTKLPRQKVFLEFEDYQSVALAIKEMKVRGAPAIGVAAAYGIALGAIQIRTDSREKFLDEFDRVLKVMADTRPTARNLFMAIERMKRVSEAGTDVLQTKSLIIAEARIIHKEETEATLQLSQHGADIIKDDSAVLTHCNTGPLATAGYGTALGVIIKAREQGKNIRVFVTETRPLLQGARLTAFELKEANIPFTLITDSMAGHFMSQEEIDCVIVGADRIAANGDTANKIGTYTLAVMARHHGIPFYVAAPTSTIDLSLESGKGIKIEERSPDEVTRIQGVYIAPEGTRAANPAFDITPSKYITAIITEKGVITKVGGMMG